MRKNIHALELGGTLFVPASHKNLEAVLSGTKYPELRSVVIDFEDGLASSDRQQALEKLDTTLESLKETKLLRFIRPQHPQMLKAFLQKENINNLDGFILPKFGLENANEYLSLFPFPISDSPFPWHIMPSIEGKELFDIQQLQKLREILLPHQKQIICIRFGAQDMLRQLGLRQDSSIYDMLVPRQVIANFIATFKPHGFEISAPVYPDFSDDQGFQKEVSYELHNGLTSKTIIHPKQIQVINNCYRVTKEELNDARAILKKEDGVINLNGKMGEQKTQNSWAKQIIMRHTLYSKSQSSINLR